MEQKFIIYNNGGFSSKCRSDYSNDPRVTVKKYKIGINSKFLKFLRKIHLSYKVNKIIDLPFKRIWCETLKSTELNTNTEYFFVFEASDMFRLDKSYFNSLKRKYNVHFILYLLDHLNAPALDNSRDFISKFKFDYILSFDPEDSKRYNFIYNPVPYAIISDTKSESITEDLMFVGMDKGRINKLHNIYDFLNNHDVKMFYIITYVKESDRKYEDGIVYNKEISYDKLIDQVKRSNCILECLISGQTGATLRYYEAVCYNKKLLTNNKNVVNMPFYDPRYMKVFEKPEDIDVEWVKKREDIDYHYDGRYSPVHLIDKILELENARKGQSFEEE